jgi:hypothetical protein
MRGGCPLGDVPDASPQNAGLVNDPVAPDDSAPTEAGNYTLQVVKADGHPPGVAGRSLRYAVSDDRIEVLSQAAGTRVRIGEQVRAQRIATGLSQAELARRIGCWSWRARWSCNSARKPTPCSRATPSCSPPSQSPAGATRPGNRRGCCGCSCHPEAPAAMNDASTPPGCPPGLGRRNGLRTRRP